ncbi:MAG: HEAT repeat domain-containing protein [Gemmatimonadaceae bacterium]
MLRPITLVTALWAAALGAQVAPTVPLRAEPADRAVQPPRPKRSPRPTPLARPTPRVPLAHEAWPEPLAELLRLDASDPLPALPHLLEPLLPDSWTHEFAHALHETPLARSQRPPEAWAQDDPADSLYRRARELLNRGEYRQAAGAFRDLAQKYPSSQYASAALYWEAFALYRMGGITELRSALVALETRRTKYPSAKNEGDAATLATRIRGALAARGDASAQQQLERAAQTGASCDSEDQSVRIEALRALNQSDPETVAPLIHQVLKRRDDCSIQLRRSAIYLIGNRRDATATQLLADIARSDPSLDVRTEAISWLGRMSDDAALNVLEELLRTSDEERIQRAAIRALATHPNQRAMQRVRALVERSDAPERLRAEAIATFERERPMAEEVVWLRNLYPKLDRASLKQRAVGVIARAGGAENDQWLQALLRNEEEPSEVRAAVLQRLGLTMSIGDLARLYDGASSRTIREQVIGALGRRAEAEATDKLIDIVKTGTDPTLRRSAIGALTRKKDPRTTKLLLELISQ